ncbi:heparinase II/III family protein [Paenibacillus qinlingensis]|uniref:Alginate lyase domain-containing protein n=1 Tax=Paenibacillus qinlingensis TaxID=1837343 RepID=A0ABU1NWK4_9BACL|nr:heparinase II/III family protein [Paenibacillus qinlingensis]MDR6551862.1 hypothetical protein [Paenibacillus qinlingensis]
MNEALFSPAFFKQIQEKCYEVSWAQQALDKLEQQAEKRWESLIDIPLLGGGWSHDYNCPGEGAKLVRIDRHHHRCPSCGNIWSGSPWDEVAIRNEHIDYSVGSWQMAVLYGLTGSERAAVWTKQVLLFYAEHYEQYVLHDRIGGTSKDAAKVMCQTLSESSWVLPLVQAYCILKQHGVVNLSEQQRIEQNWLLKIVPLLDGNQLGISNWQSYHNAARAWIAAATDRQDLLEKAVYDTKHGFLFQMENSLSDDGFWYEGAWGYHFYTLGAQVDLVLAAHYMNVPLYKNERFQSMFRAPLQCMLPDGTLPPVHDSDVIDVKKLSHLFEFSSAFFGEGYEVAAVSERDSLMSLLYGPPHLDGEAQTSSRETAFTELKKAGMILMKQTASAQVAMVDFGKHGGYHGHRDKLSLLYYTGGHAWLNDAGMLPYGNAMHERFFKQTIAHNTVTIGGCSQAEAEGTIVKAEQDEKGWIYLETETSEAYPGTVLRRHCVLTDKLLVDVFDVYCDEPQDVDWIIHTQGSPVLAAGRETPVEPILLGEQDGYDCLKQTIQWSPELTEVWHRTWSWDQAEHNGDHFDVYGLMPSTEGTSEEIYLAESPAMPSMGKRSTIIRRRLQVKNTRFIAIFRACTEGDKPLQVEVVDAMSGLQVQVTYPEGNVDCMAIPYPSLK